MRDLLVDNLVPVNVIKDAGDLISAKADASSRSVQRLLQMMDERMKQRAQLQQKEAEVEFKDDESVQPQDVDK